MTVALPFPLRAQRGRFRGTAAPLRWPTLDLWPIFHTGVPNLIPYQLATGKAGNPLAAGKPFINNFLPNGGDMLRLNMAVPATPRNDPNFSSLGLIQAAVLGLTNPSYNGDATIQFIPNMDGFPNGRRLEDDVTRIELQAVGGVVLAAVGLWYDDYKGGPNPVTPQLVNVLTYSTGVNANDTSFSKSFPYEQTPWSGSNACCGLAVDNTKTVTPAGTTPESDQVGALNTSASTLDLSAPDVFLTASPNPFVNNNTIRYHMETPGRITIAVYDLSGQSVKVLADQQQDAGTYSIEWNSSNLAKGVYLVTASRNGGMKQTLRLVKK